MVTILGIDPGSRKTGFGIIRTDGRQHRYLDSGWINAIDDHFPTRLAKIFNAVSQLLTTYSIDEAAVEQVFVAKNASSALKLGHARGAAITALTHHQLKVNEYSAREVKKAIVGFGAAEKNQMQHMVKILLNLPTLPQEDAADALAVAICHAHLREMERLVHARSV